MKLLQNVTEALWNRCGTLWDITELLRDTTEALRECYGTLYGTLRNVTEHYRAFQDITERYGSITGCCGQWENENCL